jgi:hypothetical protein
MTFKIKFTVFLDEENCTKSCNDEEFKCADDSLCVGRRWQCDGMPDCPDGSGLKNDFFKLKFIQILKN